MRYLVRDGQGRELVVPSLADLHRLYEGGFLADDDLVRAETARRWVRVGEMPALHGVRDRRADPRRMLVVLAAIVALVAALALLVGRRRLGAP